MKKVYRVPFNYLAVVMLLVANLLPVTSVFAEGVAPPNENIFDSPSLSIKADAEANTENQQLVDVTYEVTNKSEAPINQLIIHQKNENDTPVKFDEQTLKNNQKLVESTDPIVSFEKMEKAEGTQLRIATLQPNETRKLSITGEQTNRSVDQLAVEVKQSEKQLGELKLNLPRKELAPTSTTSSPIQESTAQQESSTPSQPTKETTSESESTVPTEKTQTEESQSTSEEAEDPDPGLPQAPMAQGPRLAPTPGRGFEKPIYNSVHKGELFSTGNTNLKILDEKEYRANIFLNTKAPSSGYSINNFVLEFADVDGDPTTYNSSRAYIDLDGAKEIAWAGLFWSSSRYKGPTFGTNLSDEEISEPVKFTTPNGTSQRVAPQYYHRIDQDKTDPGQYFGYNNTGFSNYADVTSIIQGDGSGTGGYTLADIPMTKALNQKAQYYNFSGWSLFVVTKDQAKHSRAFNVYYGARGNKAGTNNEFVMKDFITAKQGKLEPIVTWFTVQGDKLFTGDNAQIKNSAGTFVNIINTINPVGNVMNATVSDNDQHMVDKYPGQFNPGHPNFLDIDIDRLSLPEGLISNGQNQISFRTTSIGDDFSTNAVGFSVNAEIPELEINKEIVNPKETYKIGETVTYRVHVKNTKENSEAVNTLSKDVLDSRLDYVPGSLSVVSGPNAGQKTDASGDDQAEYTAANRTMTVRVGEGANATTGGSYKGTTTETVYEFQAKINGTAVAEQLIPNRATVQGTDAATNTALENQSNVVEVKVEKEELPGKIESTKTVNNQSPKLGEEIDYTINFKNTVENGVLNQVTITDSLPKGLTYVENSIASSGNDPKPTSMTVVNGKVTAVYPKITDTATRSITFKVRVNEEAVAGQAIINQAIVDDDVNPPIEPEVPVTPVETPGVLESNKSVNDQSPKLGEEIEYRITFRNKITNGVLKQVTIKDTLPTGLTYVEGSLTSEGDDPQPTNLTAKDGTITAEYGKISDTKTRTIIFKVKVNEEAKVGEPIINKATIDDGTNPPDEPETPVTPEETPGVLESNKSVNDQSPKLGDEIEYRITFRNKITNGVLKKVTIKDTLPTGLTYVEGSLTSEGDDPQPTTLTAQEGIITAEYGKISDTKTRTIIFKVKVNEEAKVGETIVNRATIDDGTNPPDEPETPVTPEETPGVLESTKTVNDQSPRIGDEIEYRITFRNKIQNGVLKQVTVTDNLPKGLTYVEDSLTSEGDDPQPTKLVMENGKLTAEYGTISDTKSRTIMFKVKVNEEAKVGEQIINKATIDDGTNPPDEPEIPVTPEETPGELESTKTVNNQSPKIGDEIEYRIMFRNKIQNGVLKQVTVTDNLPKGLTYVEGSLKSEGNDPKPTKLIMENGKLTAEYGSITDTSTRTIVFKVTVNQEAKAGETIVNKASIDDGTNPPDEPETPVTPVVTPGQLEVTKTVNHQSPKIGDEIEYRISFRNKVTNGVIDQVTITDTLPKGLTYVEGSLTNEGADPQPTSLEIENGKITAEYSNITDTTVRSLVFKVKVNEEAKVGEPIVNKATIDDHINPPDEPETPVTPVETPGELESTKSVNHQSPKIGEEIEYRINFRNKVTNGVLNQVTVTDKLPKGLTYVEGSLTSEGDDPQPINLTAKDGTILAEYGKINDTKIRSIVFKVKVNEEAKTGETIINKATIDDGTNPPDEPETPVTPVETPGVLESTKVVNDQSPKLGDEIEYRITFRNKVTNGVLKQVTVTDNLPKGLTYVEGSLMSEGDDPQPTSLTMENGKLVAEYTGIADTKVRSIVFKVKVNEQAKVGETIVNKANIDDHINPPDEPEIPVTPEETPGELETTKTVNNQSPKLGEEIEYRITFRNKVTNGVLNQVTVTDNLPRGLTYVEGSLTSEGDDPQPTSLDYKDGTIAAEYGKISDTKVRSIVFKVKVNEEAKVGETIINKANIDDHINPPDEPEIPVTPEETPGKLETTKTVNNQSPKLGEELEYRITFRNKVTNGVLNQVTVTDNLPRGLTYVEGSLTSEGDDPQPTSLDYKDGTITAEYGKISDTKVRSIVFKVKVNEQAKVGETIINKANIDDHINPPDEPEIPVTPEETRGELETTKTVNNQSPKLGEEIEYRITFRNKVTNGVLNQVTVTDNLPRGLTYVEGSLTSEGDDPQPTSLGYKDGTITAEYGKINDTKVRSIIFKVKVNEEAKVGETIVNKATIDDHINPPDEPEVPVTPEETPGKLESTKTVNKQKTKVGEELEYRITFRNKVTNGVLNQVTVTDNLPKGLTYVEGSLTSEGDQPEPTSLTYKDGTITAEYGKISDTKARSIVFKVKVNKNAVSGKEILNIATVDDHVTPPDKPEVPVVPEDPDQPKVPDGKLVSEKTVNQKTVKIGEELEYRISFHNTVEHGILNQVTVTDKLPKGLTYIEDSLTSEGDEPQPTSVTYKDGTITAEYGKISDTKVRTIVFKVKVNKEAVAGKEILNIATVDDHVTPPSEPEVPVIPENPDKPEVPVVPNQPNKPDVPVVPEKEVPNRPEPRKPAPKEKEARKSFLPKTGEAVSYTLIALGGILVVIVLVVAVKKRKQ
ncbi:isopeptide-forming domain-containing fimbrial protein [Enterococcus mundtii]|uniref:isopeptide-forming domain-containing fimbrial protein n=10 Tax=Enterococcus mundtii TaxID=53346 RepID=UPI00136FC6CB|nr:isopeptide-forming domain-containing fimbrial protein [Enterococcus mundtii]MZZ58514.1 isopeptide-forming domain-containing fimbrial protein [Enterococcus mundtii]MZZ97279.1 isopeptide-forming domain-containing fimbrial protein [Enterococcus mundtii]